MRDPRAWATPAGLRRDRVGTTEQREQSAGSDRPARAPHPQGLGLLPVTRVIFLKHLARPAALHGAAAAAGTSLPATRGQRAVLAGPTGGRSSPGAPHLRSCPGDNGTTAVPIPFPFPFFLLFFLLLLPSQAGRAALSLEARGLRAPRLPS